MVAGGTMNRLDGAVTVSASLDPTKLGKTKDPLMFTRWVTAP
jgi:hypothetical protein